MERGREEGGEDAEERIEKEGAEERREEGRMEEEQGKWEKEVEDLDL